ncbi:asparagine--tRNA ligase [Membranihabitans marinus]|uniref:asparagine--tRNA ligase n=1 Tax=Membranihabitans marinus TaxID=1227546 RepID=UPI001F0051DD|nr:asparagine--tRNA ligase [Membranihabitans marinus]
MQRTRIDVLLSEQSVGQTVVVKGWVKSFRNNQFISINDGSCFDNIQAVLNRENYDIDFLKTITPGTALKVVGTIVASQGSGQAIEIDVTEIEIYGTANAETYPLQPKKHSKEFLREIAHLRFRTNTFGAVFRIRHAVSFAIHSFFNDRKFYYLHTPIITASDAEGAGEMFRVSTLDLAQPPKTESGDIDFKADFFERETHLTVSGQLEAELGALALGQVYTFGPTFRAENSNTSRHLAEFWMVEPEVAFADLHDNMDLAEAMLKHIISYVLEHCQRDLQFLNDEQIKEESQKPKNQRSELSLIERLQSCIADDFVRISYTEAIEILKNSKPNKKKKFNYIIEEWGADLQSEHERYLVEKHFKKPVILFDYPKDIKAFYMKVNEDNKTVRAMDILFPGIGEIIGGSQREENLDVLLARMEEMDVPAEELYWYLDIRKYGSCPHSGYGLGFERMVQFVTGMGNIRDVIPFPRTPGNAAF